MRGYNMRFDRKLSIMLALAALLALYFALPACALTPEDYDKKLPQMLEEDHLYAEAAVLMDAMSGRVLFTKNAHQRMYPASTTKIMTLMLALESNITLDTPVVIPQQAAKIPKDSTLVPVFPGDQMTFGDLLYGFMLASGNDAANAIAVLVGGSVDAFVDRMNQRAQELGCTDTHFVNAHGYHDPDHYTTAMDLARITQAALEIDMFRQISACERYTFTIRRDGEDITPTRANSNVLLNDESRYYYADCIGVKTGTHSMAGNCFVGAAERDGVRLVSVVLKCPQSNQKWTDTIRLFDYGYTRYKGISLEQLFTASSDQIATVKISNASNDDPEGGVMAMKIAQISNPDYTRMISLDSDTAMDEAVADFVSRSTMTITHDMVAPVSEGEIMGRLRYVAQSGEEITALLIASRDVKEQPPAFDLLTMFPALRRLQDPLVRALLIVAPPPCAAGHRQRERAKIYQVRRRQELHAERAENKRRRDRARRHREAVRRDRREKWERHLADDRDYDFVYDDEDDFDEDDFDDDEYDDFDDDYDDFDEDY